MYDTTKEELLEMICGPKIGSGCFRDVYVNNLNPKTVIKVQHDYSEPNAHNMMEYIISEKFFLENDIFAPVHCVSKSGKFLIMERTSPVSEKEFREWLEKTPLPNFVNDIKSSNVGWLDDKIVIHDYGVILLDHTKRIRNCGGTSEDIDNRQLQPAADQSSHT
jgi:hypothetical protein